MTADQTGVAAWESLLRVHAALVPILDREVQRATGLPLAWYDVLLELNSAPNRRLRMTDLADRVVLSRTRVSRIVDELVSHGLVARDDNPADRRSAYAVLTAEGRRRFRAAAPVYLAGIARHFSDQLTQVEANAVRSAMRKVLRAQRG
ncbi:MAG: MarR family transcriptional regulator [Candidatus Dormibacteraeota bacterium]|nr:MarR family transcriptional regulator [Candidatus Dormibacteraeota bacterium]